MREIKYTITSLGTIMVPDDATDEEIQSLIAETVIDNQDEIDDIEWEEQKKKKENKSMRYIKFTLSNGYCGCTNEHFEVFEDGMTNEDLDNYGRELALDNAETYAYVATGWDEDFESEEEEEYYYNNVEFYWEELSKEEFEEENR